MVDPHLFLLETNRVFVTLTQRHWRRGLVKRLEPLAIGDIYIEPLPGMKRILKGLGLSSGDTSLHALWVIKEVLSFNYLPHVRIFCEETGESRLISSYTLHEGRTYKKQL